MTTEKLVEEIEKAEKKSKVKNGEWLENTAKLIQQYDEKNPNSSVILLLGAGDVDGLRYEIM
jgi:UDP-N-acetylmuramate-alanine ligase